MHKALNLNWFSKIFSPYYRAFKQLIYYAKQADKMEARTKERHKNGK